MLGRLPFEYAIKIESFKKNRQNNAYNWLGSDRNRLKTCYFENQYLIVDNNMKFYWKLHVFKYHPFLTTLKII